MPDSDLTPCHADAARLPLTRPTKPGSCTSASEAEHALRRFLFWGFSLVLLLCFHASGLAMAQESLCAEVKIVIEQKLSLERQAFDAHMVISNGLENTPLEKIGVELYYKDQYGQTVLATSDPNVAGASFFQRVDSLSGIGAIDGSAGIPAKSKADIHWLIIPAAGTGGMEAKGKVFYIGARLTYTFNGQVQVVDVVPDYVVVKPQPLLKLDYFFPREVYADDPFTPETEPQEPFTLGVRISNVGGGSATRTRIESAQPKIVENKQGLLIDFQILGGYVADMPAGKSLLLDFGDIASGSARVGRWNMVTTLAGRFVEFSADYSHADNLGGALTSLVQRVDTHTLLRDVLVDVNGRDGIRDFLAKDGETLTVYESDGINSLVVDQSGQAELRSTGAGHDLKFPPVQGFAYVKLPDPSRGVRIPGRVFRSDGKQLPLENIWLSRVRNADLSWSHFINLFDANTSGEYRIEYAASTVASLSGTAYRDLNANGMRDAGEPGLGLLPVTVKGVDDLGVSVSTTAYTEASGSFSFVGLKPGLYQIESVAMDGLLDGVWLAGSAGGTARPGLIGGIRLAAGTDAQGYLLGKRADSGSNSNNKADLSIRLSAAPTRLRNGETLTLTLTAANAGPFAAPESAVAMTLPTGWTMQGVVTGKGSYAAGKWMIGTMAPGESTTLTVSAISANLAASTLIGAQIGAKTDDPVASNNSASVVIAKNEGSVDVSQRLPNDLRLLLFTSCQDTKGQADAACAAAKAVFMQGYLSRLGIEVTTVTSIEQLQQGLRSGAHNGIWLNAAGLEIGDALLDEIREAVRRGGSLIVDGLLSERLVRLAEVSGAHSGPRIGGDAPEIVFNDGTPSVRMPKGAVRALQLSGASELASVSDAGAPFSVAARNRYGLGKTLAAGFDIAVLLQQTGIEPLIGQFLQQQLESVVAAADEPRLPGSLLSIDTEIGNRSGDRLAARTTTTLPNQTTLNSAKPVPASVSGQQVLWKTDLAVDQSEKIRAVLRLRKSGGSVLLRTTVDREEDGRVFGEVQQTVNVLGTDTLLPRIIAAIGDLSAADQPTRERIARARNLVNEAQTAFTANEHQAVIARLVEAENLLLALDSTEAANLRLDLSRWIGIAGMLWHEGGAGSVASRIVATAGTPQSAIVGQGYANELLATVFDADNRAMAGVEVIFRLPSTGAGATFPGGLLTAISKTDAQGVARSPGMTANAISGAWIAEASVEKLVIPARFALENRAAPLAERLEVVAGTPQEAVVGKSFAPLKLRVLDGSGAPMGGVQVLFQSPDSGPSANFLGTSISVSVTTDLAGVAASPALIANARSGNYLVLATVPGVAQGAEFRLRNLDDPDALLGLQPVEGSEQASLLNRLFPARLAVRVTNRSDQVRPGVIVRFSLPVSGASARFADGTLDALVASGIDGVARSPLLTANDVSGHYSAQASSDKAPVGASFSLVNLAPGADGKQFAGLTASGSGTMIAMLSGGGAGCVFKPEATSLLPATEAHGASKSLRFPHGIFAFALQGCVPGSKVTLSSTWPGSPRIVGYRSFGRVSGGNGAQDVYIPDELRILGSTTSHVIVDGGAGDDDFSVNGSIRSQGGPVSSGRSGKAGGALWLLLN